MLQLATEDSLVSPSELRRLTRLCAPTSLSARQVEVQTTATGTGAEIPLDDPLLQSVAQRLLARVGLPDAPVATLRLRDCSVGQGHPPHFDDYPVAGRWLLATAVLHLDACQGGRTRFPTAGRMIEPQPGRAAWWLNLDAAGQPEAEALHDMEPVARGRRRALFLFIYASAAEVAAAAQPGSFVGRLGTVDPARWPVPHTLHLVTDRSVPSESISLLRQAARARRVAVDVHDPATSTAATPLPPGDLLFCPATAATASALERRLWQPGVISFHTQPRGPYSEIVDPLSLFTAMGLPVPRSERLPWVDAEQVQGALERLGGLPVVAKLGGAEGGVGVMRLDTYTSLLTVLEAFALRRESPLLQAHVADAVHWRLVVVGERVVASYRNPQREDGFRSRVSADPADYTATPPEGAEALAVAAAQALQVALAGVDLLAHPSGRLYLLEANFPCYYPMAQRIAGIDVAGAMVDWLLARADAATLTSTTTAA